MWCPARPTQARGNHHKYETSLRSHSGPLHNGTAPLKVPRPSSRTFNFSVRIPASFSGTEVFLLVVRSAVSLPVVSARESTSSIRPPMMRHRITSLLRVTPFARTSLLPQTPFKRSLKFNFESTCSLDHLCSGGQKC